MRYVPKVLWWLVVVVMTVTLSRPLLHTDEVATLLAVNARSTDETLNFLRTLPPENALDRVHDFITHNPDATLGKAIDRHLREEPQFSPLYLIVAFVWTKCLPVVEPLLALRFLSLMALVLAIQVAWSCLSQMGVKFSPSENWKRFAVGLSPALWILGREARFYSLWALFLLLTWWAVLGLLRHSQKKTYWIVWTLASAVAINLQVLQIFVWFPQALFLAVSLRKSRLLKRIGLASAVLGATYLPWAWQALHSPRVSSNMQHLFSPNRLMLTSLVKVASRTFWDWDVSRISSSFQQATFVALGMAWGLSLLGFALYFWRNTPSLRSTLTALFAPTVLMILVDSFVGTSLVGLQRYLLPFSAALLLGSGVSLREMSGFVRSRASALVLASWLLGSGYSVVSIAEAAIWRSHPYGFENRDFVENRHTTMPSSRFRMSEFFSHLSTANPGSSDFIRGLILLGRLESFRGLLPPEERPEISW